MNKKYLNFRTDMADERVDTYKKVHNLTDVDGIKVTSKSDNSITTTIVDVLNKNGEMAVSKKIGKYITIEVPDIVYVDESEKEDISNEISNNIKTLIGKDKSKSVLIVGLGNVSVTPDALGPKVVKYVEITRHLLHYAKDLVEPNTREISAISPGVLGTTGLETSEIITSIVENIKPDALIVIDSLASGSIHRIGNTIQLSNTGITPGDGVRNKRDSINEENLKIPVISLGVPTVVDMATITNEAIDKLIDSAKDEAKNVFSNEKRNNCTDTLLSKLEQDTRYDMIANALNTQNYIVTPKEVDELINIMSEIIANGINLSLNIFIVVFFRDPLTLTNNIPLINSISIFNISTIILNIIYLFLFLKSFDITLLFFIKNIFIHIKINIINIFK